MTRRQKLILVILGILDIVVIALLSSVVIRSMRSAPAASPIVVQASPCEQRLVEMLSVTPPFADEVPTIAWDDQQLSLSLRIPYTTPTPPEDSAQYLWAALDVIAEIVLEECPLPETVTIAVEAQGATEVRQFLAQVSGVHIEHWLDGSLSEEALAAQARYRQTTASP